MAGIDDVARAAGTSKSTVSRVLRNHAYVAAATRQRVLEAMKALNYRPNELARGLTHGMQRMVAVVVPDIRNEFFARLVHGVQEAFWDPMGKGDYRVMVMNTEEDSRRELYAIRAALGSRVSGIAIVPSSTDRALSQTLHKIAQPVVCLSREPWSDGVDAVLFDNRQAGYMATSHLMELGHRRIAYLAGPDSSKACVARTVGFETAMAEAGLPLDPNLIGRGDLEYDAGLRFADRLISENAHFSAVFASNDAMALGVIDRLSEAGIRVPDDVSVIGLDDIRYASRPGTLLTTVRQSPEEMGRRGAELLKERMGGSEGPSVRVSYAPVLMRRRTTAAASVRKAAEASRAQPAPVKFS